MVRVRTPNQLKQKQSKSPQSKSQPHSEQDDADRIADLLDLYVFPGPGFVDKSPLDYENTPDGTRKGMSAKPNGVVQHDLRPGAEDCILPPRLVWDNGKYFQELSTENKAQLRKYLNGMPEFQVYMVTGEYTPGNYLCRMYVLPKTVAEESEPMHPLLWSDYLRKGKATTYYNTLLNHPGGATTHPSTRFGFHQPTPGPTTPATPAKLPPPVEKKIPLSVKIRCGGCGHWFSNNDLPTHAEFCCPGVNGDDSDWAMQCLCCDELDQVASRKPGFPRPKPKPKAKAKAAAKTTTSGKEGTVAEATEKPAEEPVEESTEKKDDETPTEETTAPAEA